MNGMKDLMFLRRATTSGSGSSLPLHCLSRSSGWDAISSTTTRAAAAKTKSAVTRRRMSVWSRRSFLGCGVGKNLRRKREDGCKANGFALDCARPLSSQSSRMRSMRSLGASTPTNPLLWSKVDPSIVSMYSDLCKLRHDLHMHPELGLEEERTPALLAERLRKLSGMEVEEGVGRTGVVATLTGTMDRSLINAANSGSHLAVGLRADMDCLPMQEENSFAHASIVPGRMHACGHDGHSTMLIGAAEWLSANRHTFAGKVHFFFQPAEENAGGARLMIKEGGILRERFLCDEVYGVHNWPYIPRGQVSVRAGPVMASNDEFDITVRGVGGHAAIPHSCVDPVLAAANIVTTMQSIVSRSLDPLRASVVSITQINAGTAYNVIPEYAVIKGTIRTFDESDRDEIIERISCIAEGVAAGSGATAAIKIRRGYPATVNTEDEAQTARQAAVMVTGEDNVVCESPSMTAEDFSYMLQQAPGCYAWIGAQSEGMLHETCFDFDDQIIPLGVQYFCNIVQLRLGQSFESEK